MMEEDDAKADLAAEELRDQIGKALVGNQVIVAITALVRSLQGVIELRWNQLGNEEPGRAEFVESTMADILFEWMEDEFGTIEPFARRLFELSSRQSVPEDPTREN